MHLTYVEDGYGDVVDVTYFCSDFCASYCPNYDGWNGANEAPDYSVECDECGTVLVEG
jgi:hypothetical protein